MIQSRSRCGLHQPIRKSRLFSLQTCPFQPMLPLGMFKSALNRNSDMQKHSTWVSHCLIYPISLWMRRRLAFAPVSAPRDVCVATRAGSLVDENPRAHSHGRAAVSGRAERSETNRQRMLKCSLHLLALPQGRSCIAQLVRSFRVLIDSFGTGLKQIRTVVHSVDISAFVNCTIVQAFGKCGVQNDAFGSFD